MTAGLTHRMAECVRAIRKLTADGVAPTIRELQIELGDKNIGGVHALLCDLRDRGAVTWTPRGARTLRLVERPSRDDLARLSDDDLQAVAADVVSIMASRCGIRPAVEQRA